MDLLINTQTTQTNKCNPAINNINNIYGIGPAYRLVFPCSFQRLNRLVSFETLDLYFVRIGNGPKYILYIEVQQIVVETVILGNTSFLFDPLTLRYTGSWERTQFAGQPARLYIVLRDNDVLADYRLQITGLTANSPTEAFLIGAVAIATLQFNTGTNAPVQPSNAPNPPLPESPGALMSKKKRVPILTIKCGNKDRCYFSKSSSESLLPQIFIEAISAA